jgi:hypothetical protein
VRAFDIRTASAAMGGTPPLVLRLAAGSLASSQAGRTRERSLEERTESGVDFVWRYARM